MVEVEIRKNVLEQQYKFIKAFLEDFTKDLKSETKKDVFLEIPRYIAGDLQHGFNSQIFEKPNSTAQLMTKIKKLSFTAKVSNFELMEIEITTKDKKSEKVQSWNNFGLSDTLMNIEVVLNEPAIKVIIEKLLEKYRKKIVEVFKLEVQVFVRVIEQNKEKDEEIIEISKKREAYEKQKKVVDEFLTEFTKDLSEVTNKKLEIGISGYDVFSMTYVNHYTYNAVIKETQQNSFKIRLKKNKTEAPLVLSLKIELYDKDSNKSISLLSEDAKMVNTRIQVLLVLHDRKIFGPLKTLVEKYEQKIKNTFKTDTSFTIKLMREE